MTRRIGWLALCLVSFVFHLIAQSAAPSFEVASIRLIPPGSNGYTSISPPGSAAFKATNVTLEVLIGMAYQTDSNRISGEPSWLDSQQYDVSAKPEGAGGLTYEQLRPLLRNLLEQRFQLATHREPKQVQGYGLVTAKNGPKLQPTKGGAYHSYILKSGLDCQNVSLDTLAGMLTGPAGRPIINATGIRGNYDIKLSYAPDGAANSPLPSVFTALQEQIGLQLASRKVTVQTLVIDRVERVPSAN